MEIFAEIAKGIMSITLGPSNVRVSLGDIQACISQYNFVRIINTQSGQGAVFEVFDSNGESKVLKLFFPSQDPRRIVAEVDVLRQISHSAFLQVYDCAQVTVAGLPCVYTVMEYIEGIALQERCDQNNPFSDNEFRVFLRDLGDALNFLWSRRIVHRDIKPANILCEQGTSRLVLIDLAYARHLLLPSITAPGGNPGTLGYKSPEQEAGLRALTVKSDIFSLGITAYQLRSNEHPYLFRQYLIGTHVPTPLNNIVQGVDPILSALVMRMMESNPVFRPSPSEVSSSL